MRYVFGFLAAAVILGGWTVCPVSVQDQVTRTVTPDAQTVEEIRAGAEVIAAALAFRSPDLDGEDEAPVRR
ncbi:MAG: hypothetical protein ACQRW7_04830 [Caulobacterales bacterium]|uniref:hypothetical protein n=1 Tax=Glycocaulis sp. TaxID=1969725 RepID=UPI003FA10578